ncbi:uncharacterized protein AC631_05138 [Debaryomyces fabryi]|uniref:PRP1 splicing factor N-terminal domain-containing protein n=1 Tax=Debaryomyces fabryi TaxID=58627 RepID=A0A0V1PSG6_9ASCO|nr:uncharacterized protein AC631_05138 [Debaryomyces fabryi]KRZ99108.1 hypothetical protein AC631_05138 [Debaryomyces fabryi]CUM56472.1 unnamed protein product [Debaryomyces fabryi]
MDRKAFLDQEPPAGYIAGIGRGAAGFTTSADTGSVRIQPGIIVLDNEEEDINGSNAEDENDDGLLGKKLNRDQDDEEADRIYEEIDRRMERKRKDKTSTEEETELASVNNTKEQFADLKRALSGVSDEQWENLPEVGDLTRRNKRARLLEQQQQRFYAMPDSVIAGAGSIGGGSISKNSVTDFQSISGAKDKLLSRQLDSLVPQSANDATEDIQNDIIAEEELVSKVGDIKKGRLILSSLRKTNPYKANSWIASARLEEQAKNYTAAKNFIVEGCRKVPHSEDIWLESIHIHQKSTEGTKMCKIIVTEALKFNNTSEKLWIKAFELENASDIVSRRRILMKALEFLPQNVKLWERLIDLEEDPKDVAKLLHKAIELCPNEWTFWISLINLSNYAESKNLLNKARKSMSDNHKVWIAAAKLEEREHEDISVKKLSTLMEKGIKKLENSISDKSKLLSRQEWLGEAANTEIEGFNKTCQAIVNNVLNIDIPSDPKEKLSIWFKEAGHFANQSRFETSNCIYQYIIEQFPNNSECWMRLFSSLKQISPLNLDRLFSFYEQAIKLNPQFELFALMYAKDKWILAKDVDGAREILKAANKVIPESEAILLAQVKLEIKNMNYEAANKISTATVELLPASSPRVWYKHIHLKRVLNMKSPDSKYRECILSLCNESLERFPDCDKLYLQKGQILLQDLKNMQIAREVYSIGVKKCPKSIDLWLSLVRIDEREFKILIRARSMLDTAILNNPTSEELWNEKIGIERRNNDNIIARQICNKALRDFPNSPLLWIQNLQMIPKMSQRKNAFLDALKLTDNSPLVLLHIGIFFWLDGKFMKAKSWFERALNGDKNNGDCWGWLFNFIDKHGSDSEKQTLLENFEKQYEGINKGRTWNLINKKVENFEKTPTELLLLVGKQLITASTV